MDEDKQREVCEKLNAAGYATQPDRNGNIYVGESAEQLEKALAEHEQEYLERERDIIVVGGGGFSMGMVTRTHLGASRIGMKFAALALAQSIEIGCVAEPVHDYLTESKPRPQYSRPKELTPGERKFRNKKLKTQRNSRRYNRKR
jgi:hypothetical protein